MAGPGIGVRFICQSSQIVHAGFQGHSQPPTLFKRQVPLAAFDFGIVALIDTCEHLNLYLGVAPGFSQLLQSGHDRITQAQYGKLTY